MSAVQWFAMVFAVATMTLVAVIFVMMPSLLPKTLPLGVSIPADRVGEPVVRDSVRRYRLWVGVSWVACVALGVVLALTAPPAVSTLTLLLFTLVAWVVYLVARRPIQVAKRASGWYQGATVRLTASITDTPAHRAAVPVIWYIASALVVAATAVVGVAHYGQLPAQVVTHWGVTGPDAWAPTTVGSVFGPLIVALGVIILTFACALLARYAPARIPATDHPEVEIRGSVAARRLIQDLLGWLTLAIAIQITLTSLLGWFRPDSGPLAAWVSMGMAVVTLALIVVFVIQYRRALAPQEGAASTVSSPDTDTHWKAGSFYVNRDDPALFIPKRFGVGWSLNFGHPAAFIILIVLAAVILATTLLPGGH